MAYSTNLDPAVPGQAEKAKLGAGRIRDLTKALKERLASFFTDPDADPLVIKDNTIEMAKLTVAARTGLIRGQLFEYTQPAGTPPIPADGNLLPIIIAPASVSDKAMFAAVKLPSLSPPIGSADLSKLVITASAGIGNSINLVISNRGTSDVDVSEVTFQVLVIDGAVA